MSITNTNKVKVTDRQVAGRQADNTQGGTSPNAGPVGTVTSFSAGGLTPLFTTGVATGTTTPALTFALINKAANLVYAGPATGPAAAPDFRSLVAADIPALSYAPAALAAAHIFVGNGSNVATDVAMTGDISITNAGLTAIGANKVTLAMMATIANNTILGNISGGAAAPQALTGANVRTICGLATTDTPQFAGLVLSTATGPATLSGTWLHLTEQTVALGIQIDGFSSAAQIIGRRTGGTIAFPTNTLSGQALILLEGRGFDGSNYGTAAPGFRVVAAEDWTSTNQGAYLPFFVTNLGTTTAVEAARFSAGQNLLLGLTGDPFAAGDWGNLAVKTAIRTPLLFGGQVTCDPTSGGVSGGGAINLAASAGAVKQSYILGNWYYGGSPATDRMAITGGSSLILFSITDSVSEGLVAGDLAFYTAPSVAANTAISWTRQLHLHSGGGITLNDYTNIPSRLGVGVAADASRTLKINGVISILDGGTQNLPAGVVTEVGAKLLEFGINEGSGNRFGTYDSTYQGGFFRFDARVGEKIMQFYGRAVGDTSNAGNLLMFIEANGNMTINGGSLTTGAPLGGTAAAWKLGVHEVGAVQADVAGVLYHLTTTEGVFGGLYIHDGVTAQSIANGFGTVYTKLTGFNTAQGHAGQSSNTTPSTANSMITVGKIGRYLVSWAASGSINTSNIRVAIAAFAAGVEVEASHGATKHINSGDLQEMAGVGYVQITSLAGTGGDIDLRATQDNGAAINYIPLFLNLTATRVGD